MDARSSEAAAPAAQAREWLPSRLASAAVAAAIAFGLLFALRRFFHDDAYIALRYARNLLDGQGLVFNPGERVEGYTSLLWVLASALLGRFGVGLPLASRALGLLSLAGLFALLARRSRADALAVVALAGLGPLLAWSLGGLETAGFTLIVTAALLEGEAAWQASEAGARNRRALVAGLLLGLAALCRPEGALFFAVLFGLLALDALRGRLTAAPAFAAMAGFAPLTVALLAWRFAYYGDWLPNTFYVKAASGFGSAIAGATYLGRFLLAYPALLLLAALGWRRWRMRPAPGEPFLFASVIAYLAYVIWVGGDHMQWFRFVVPVLPAVALLLVRRLEQFAGARPWARFGRAGAVLLAAALSATSTLTLAVERGWRDPDRAAARGRLVGLYARRAWPASATVALNTAGSTPFFSGLRAIDMLGLNDRTIARRAMPPPPPSLPWAALPGHRKGDGAYVLSRRPEFIIIGGSEGDFRPWFAGDLELVKSAAFARDYVARTAAIEGDAEMAPFTLRYYVRRDLLQH